MTVADVDVRSVMRTKRKIEFVPREGASMLIVFTVAGACGAVRFQIITGWRPKLPDPGDMMLGQPTSAVLVYHSPIPRESFTEAPGCDLYSPCYSDLGPGMTCTRLLELFYREGEEPVFRYLEREYEEIFDAVV